MPMSLAAFACVVFVGHDPGGSIEAYERRLADIEARECLVVFDGVTKSAATILLGATHTCVADGAVFTFHGPSWNGRRMAPVDFAYWRNRIARNYPAPVRRWYLATVHDDSTIHTVKRSEMIRIGTSECAP